MLFKKYRSKLISIVSPISGIYSLEFLPDRGEFKYNPGQFLHLALDAEYDGVGQWPDSRCFSMQSSPEERKLRITYAVKGKFTGQMEQSLKVGSRVWLKLPYGDLFTQPHSKEETVFIAGGTGITPFLSLFTNKGFREYINPRIYLGYRTPEHNIYNKQLKESYVPPQSITYFYQDTEGIIDISRILKENGSNPNYFISGPPAMIQTFKTYLLDNGVPSEKIKTDDWM